MKFFQLSGFERGEIKLRSYKAKLGKFFNYEKGEEEEERERDERGKEEGRAELVVGGSDCILKVKEI